MQLTQINDSTNATGKTILSVDFFVDIAVHLVMAGLVFDKSIANTHTGLSYKWFGQTIDNLVNQD